MLYRSYENFGLNFNHLDEVIDRLHVIKHHLIKYSRDTQMNNILNSAKKNRKVSDSLQKFEEKKKHTHKLPAALMCEHAEPGVIYE